MSDFGYTVHGGTIYFNFDDNIDNDMKEFDKEINDYVVEHRFYVVVQKDETNMAIIERRNTIEEILPILKFLNCEVVNDLIKQGLTDENICEALYEEVTGTEMAYFLGPGKNDKGKFNIFVQSEWIKIYDENLEDFDD